MLRFDHLELFFDKASDTGRLVAQIGKTAETPHPGRIGRPCQFDLALELNPQRVGHKLPETDPAERGASLCQPKYIVRNIDGCLHDRSITVNTGIARPYLRATGGKPGTGADSRSQRASRHDGDPVGAAVCVAACRDHDGVEQIGADFPGEPAEMADVVVADRLRQLDLDRDDPCSTSHSTPRNRERGRFRLGTEITHCRTGAGGRTWSTRCAAVCAMCRPLHEGHTPRRLHEKAIAPAPDALPTRRNGHGFATAFQELYSRILFREPFASGGDACL